MECNKDEATRAKEIAERKFSEKDIMGARKFALKAQALFPGLEGVPQMLSTLDVYIAAENKINGEPDWYGILGVDQIADEETVRKQYRKLALMLHPDKNKSIGADGAFKFISEAWTLLSDKSKRTVYDQKRNVKPEQKVKSSTNQGSGSSAKASKPSTKPPKSGAARANSSAPAPNPNPHKQRPNTFWTVCHGCKMQYEYLRVYLNHNLLCPNCHEPFLAKETAPPSNGVSKTSPTWDFSTKRNKKTSNSRSGGFSGSGSHGHDKFQWSPFLRTNGTSNAAQAANMVQQAYERVRREREEAEAALRKNPHSSKRSATAASSSSEQPNSNAAKRRRCVDDFASAHDSGQDFVYEIGVKVGGISNGSASRDFSRTKNQVSLMEKARKEIRRKLEELKSKPEVKSEKIQNNETTLKGVDKSSRKNDLRERIDITGAMSINVPDPDFHDFDKDRTEKCFESNQIWATYDGDDGMPRYYAMIHSVISTNPFKIRIGWLNSTSTELGILNWISSGFSKTCGEFSVGRYEINSSLNSFSHKVWWSKGLKGIIRIYPRKGQVWALYRNWSPNWNELTPDEVIHKYDMVEVLEDFNEETGATVTPLVKVAGFKTVFHRHLDQKQVHKIQRDEIFRFSHHVPSYVLTGQEALNAPKGCRELDPAATPLELLQVVAEVKGEEEEETVKIRGKLEVDSEVIVLDDVEDNK